MILGLGHGLGFGGRVPARDPGAVFSRDYTRALSVGTMDFTRASAAIAVLNGSESSYAVNEPRVIGDRMVIDAGGTNLLLHAEDLSQSAWTKERVTVSSATAPAWNGRNTACVIRETSDTNSHQYRQTVASGDGPVTYRVVLKPDGRIKVRVQLVGNASGGSGGRADFTLTGSGTAAGVFGVGSPAGTASASIKALSDGHYELTLTADPATTGNTSVLAYVMLLDDAGANSYAGDTSKGVIHSAGWLTAGSSGVSYIRSTTTQGTRAAETATASVSDGYFGRYRSDDAGSLWETAVQASGGLGVSVTPRTGQDHLKRVSLYPVDFYDLFDRADTSAGSLGTSTSGVAWTLYGAYAGAYPLPAATDGQIVSNKYVDLGGSVVYAVAQLAEPVRHLEATFSWVDDTVGTDFTTLALIITPSANVIDTMIHVTITNSVAKLEKRVAGGTITTLGTLNLSPSLALANTQHVARLDVSGNRARLTVNDQSVTVTDDDWLTLVGDRICVEHYSASTSVRWPLTVHKVAAAYAPLGWD